MRSRWFLVVCWLGLAVNVAGFASMTVQRDAIFAIVNFFGIAFWSYNLTFVTKERREHRTAARDRDYSDASPGFVAGSPIYSGAKLTFHPIASTGVTLRQAIGANTSDEAIKESTSEIPILAYKVARLIWSPNVGPRFCGLNQQVAYAADADAHCLGGWMTGGVIVTSFYNEPSRRPEHGDCPSLTCSCGFYACTDTTMLDGGAVILEVELSGRVIVCERGYRAGHQRVIRAHLRGCHFCGCTPSVASFASDSELRLRCAQHADATPSVAVEDLTKLLGVPVDVDASVKTGIS